MNFAALTKDTTKYNIILSVILFAVSIVLIWNIPRIVFWEPQMQQQVSYFLSIAFSLYRIVVGGFIAYFLALVFSLLIFKYVKHRLKQFLMVILLLLAITPAPIWANFTISLFRLSAYIPIMTTILSTVFILIVVNVNSMNNIPQRYFHIYSTYRKSFGGEIRYVILPSIRESLIFSFRLCMLVSWIGLLMAESFGVNEGLGQMLLFGRQMFDWSIIISAWLAILACAVLTDIIALKIPKLFLN